jgi:hypothetical protein
MVILASPVLGWLLAARFDQGFHQISRYSTNVEHISDEEEYRLAAAYIRYVAKTIGLYLLS